jgi:hypothetical protein
LELLRLKLKEIPQCSICTEELIDKKAEIEPCLHVFCMPCISKWAEIENTCPNCKREFNKIVEKVVMLKVNSKQKAQYKKKPSTRSAFKNSRTNETNASTNSVGN